MPSWQSGPGVINSDSSGTPCGATSGYCREVPDVSASADWTAHPYVIFYSGQWTTNGGTSAATPLWAAMLADIESETFARPRMGFLNPVLYLMAAAGGSAFNDITFGQQRLHRQERRPLPGDRALRHGLGPGFTDSPGTGHRHPGNKFDDRIHRCPRDRIAALALPGTVRDEEVQGRFDPHPGNLLQPQAHPGRKATCRSPRSRNARRSAADGKPGSNGYTGDVYWDNTNEGGSTTLTLTLPAGIQAFYFYAEPDEFETFDLEATAQNGTTSGPLQVYGNSGADYYGFYAKGSGNFIQKIKISCNDDFAVGEFGIAK